MNNNHQIMRAALDVSQAVVRIWGTGSVGSALVCAYYSGCPWVTVNDLSDLMVLLSAPQLRRRLDELVDLNRCQVRTRGRTKEYMASPRLAEKTLNIWLSFGRSLQNEKAR